MHLEIALNEFDRETESNFNYNARKLAGTRLSRVESALADSLRSLGDADAETRARMRQCIDYDFAGRLWTLSTRLASESLRGGGSSALHAAARALVIDNDLLDYPDVCRSLGAIYDGCLRAGVDPADVISKAASLGTRSKQSWLEGFLLGPAYARNPVALGVEIVITPIGPEYQLGTRF